MSFRKFYEIDYEIGKTELKNTLQPNNKINF